jgi:hypothetical protein
MTAENQIRALHAGVCGADIPVDRCEFGAGIVLRKTYAYVMAPYLAAFHPAEPGKPHPAPWKAVSGGLGFDISLEMSVPPDFDPPKPFDHVGVLWFLIALLRLRASPMLRVPVIASHPFSDIAGLPFEPRFWPIEMESQHFCPVSNPPGVLAKADPTGPDNLGALADGPDGYPAQLCYYQPNSFREKNPRPMCYVREFLQNVAVKGRER